MGAQSPHPSRLALDGQFWNQSTATNYSVYSSLSVLWTLVEGDNLAHRQGPERPEIRQVPENTAWAIRSQDLGQIGPSGPGFPGPAAPALQGLEARLRSSGGRRGTTEDWPERIGKTAHDALELGNVEGL